MIVYSATKKEFDYDVEMNHIADKVQQEFNKHLYLHSNENEYRSWENSLKSMYLVLRDEQIDDNIRIAIEFQIPLTSKRVDFLIAGKDEEENENVVIVELKQWEEARRTSRDGIVTTFLAGAVRATIHPSYQAYSYAKAIENFNESVQEEDIKLYPCAYLHSFKDVYVNELKNNLYEEILDLAPLFTKSDVQKLRDFIKKYVRKADDGNLLYRIENGKIRPSKALQDSLVGMLNGNQEFVMIDEQKVVYETIKKIVENNLNKSEKITIIVEGGAGTGKSVIAINLLVALTKSGFVVNYTTKNSAPRKVYLSNLKKGKFKDAYIGNLFRNSGCYYDSSPNQFDCILVDESHRLTEKSGFMSNQGENQIKEIINASKVSVFFIDESQQVTTRDIGSINEIKNWAKKMGSKVFFDEDLRLVSQFRCNGSDGYIAFLDSILEIRETANTDINDLDYDFRIFDNPNEMRDVLRKKNAINNKARMLAGYCYEWKTKNEPDSLVNFDIELDNGFKAKWNFNDTTRSWAIDPASFEQVGCIHTSQGLEFDYVGVIIGKDLRFENGRVVTDQTQVAKSDKSSGIRNARDKVLADKLIRNAYKTLLTRGQKGCFVYCEDVALRDYLKNRTLFNSQSKIPF